MFSKSGEAVRRRGADYHRTYEPSPTITDRVLRAVEIHNDLKISTVVRGNTQLTGEDQSFRTRWEEVTACRFAHPVIPLLRLQ